MPSQVVYFPFNFQNLLLRKCFTPHHSRTNESHSYKKDQAFESQTMRKTCSHFYLSLQWTSDVKYDLNFRSTLWYYANGKKMTYIQYPCTKFAWFTFQPSNFHLHLPISKYNINFRRRYEWILNGLRNDCRCLYQVIIFKGLHMTPAGPTPV